MILLISAIDCTYRFTMLYDGQLGDTNSNMVKSAMINSAMVNSAIRLMFIIKGGFNVSDQHPVGVAGSSVRYKNERQPILQDLSRWKKGIVNTNIY
ncbi:hypothetical protein FQR65_LT07502 [Abscondita terminalis]|nr:hypothetical protein FQR65_LT07502 [Abscondita terminalis]